MVIIPHVPVTETARDGQKRFPCPFHHSNHLLLGYTLLLLWVGLFISVFTTSFPLGKLVMIQDYSPLQSSNNKDISATRLLEQASREHKHVVQGRGTAWERVYAYSSRNNTATSCGGVDRAMPLFSDGVAAGPILCSKNPLHPVGGETKTEHQDESYRSCTTQIADLDSSLLLAKGEAVRFSLDPVNASTHANVVKDRERHSSASGVVFLDNEHFAVISFGLSMLYLYHYDAAAMKITLLDKVRNWLPGMDRGEETELVDYDGKNLLATGNLRTASFTVFNLDWQTKKLKMVQGTFPYREFDQRTHGVRFYPSSKGSHIVAATAQFKPSPDSLMVRFYDWQRNKTLADLRVNETRHAGLSPQDVFFIDKYNMLVAFTPNYVTVRLSAGEDCRPAENVTLATRLIHFRLNFDLDNDMGLGQHEFVELQSIEYMHSHPDSISYSDGVVIMSDQFNDLVSFVAIDPTGVRNMTHIGTMTGYIMNHGVAFAPDMKSMAVTMYGDNTVIINQQFPPHIQQALTKHRLSVTSRFNQNLAPL